MHKRAYILQLGKFDNESDNSKQSKKENRLTERKDSVRSACK